MHHVQLRYGHFQKQRSRLSSAGPTLFPLMNNQGLAIVWAHLLPLGKKTINSASGAPLQLMIRSQAPQPSVAVINTCDPQVLTLSWKYQTASPRPWDHNSITWFLCIPSDFSQTSKVWILQLLWSFFPSLFFFFLSLVCSKFPPCCFGPTVSSTSVLHRG